MYLLNTRHRHDAKLFVTKVQTDDAVRLIDIGRQMIIIDKSVQDRITKFM